MQRLDSLFDVKYGNSFELNRLRKDSVGGVNFIARTSKNNGVVARVKLYENIEPFPAGLLTVSLGGSVLETFLQPLPFYTAYHIYCLFPKMELTLYEKLFYCMCIRANKFKYSYGRQANRTLADLLIPPPTDVPKWISKFSLESIFKETFNGFKNISSIKVKFSKTINVVALDNLFDPRNGLASAYVERQAHQQGDNFIPYIRPSNNQETSVDAYVKRESVDPKYIYPRGTLYVSTDGQGSHSYAYVSTSEFVPNSNVTVLVPKRVMDVQERLFYAFCITKNRYKFSYGRKPKGKRLSKLLLPESPPAYVATNQIKEILINWTKVYKQQ